jgi:hypothetical protein
LEARQDNPNVTDIEIAGLQTAPLSALITGNWKIIVVYTVNIAKRSMKKSFVVRSGIESKNR